MKRSMLLWARMPSPRRGRRVNAKGIAAQWTAQAMDTVAPIRSTTVSVEFWFALIMNVLDLGYRPQYTPSHADGLDGSGAEVDDDGRQSLSAQTHPRSIRRGTRPAAETDRLRVGGRGTRRGAWRQGIPDGRGRGNRSGNSDGCQPNSKVIGCGDFGDMCRVDTLADPAGVRIVVGGSPVGFDVRSGMAFARALLALPGIHLARVQERKNQLRN